MTRLIAMGWLTLLTTLTQAGAPPLVVGSKPFTESYVFGEIVRQTLQQAGVATVHKPGLGNTAILEQAPASGAVDVYPVNTGTIVREPWASSRSTTTADDERQLRLRLTSPWRPSADYRMAAR